MDVLCGSHTEVKTVMLAVIVGSARAWHAIASICAGALIAIDLAVVALFVAALLTSDRKAHLIPTSSEFIIDVALIGGAAHVIRIDL